MPIRAIFLALFISTLSIAALGQSAGKNDENLKALAKQMSAAQMAFDVETLDAIFTPDYIEISPIGELDIRAKVLGFYAPEMKPPGGISGNVDFTEFSIRDYGKFAVVIVNQGVTGVTFGGKPIPPRSMRVTLVCRLEKGAWKIASVQYTPIRPKQPQLPKTQ